jgi:DNA mismatch endonuclease (patch repair protein)
MAAIKGRDTKPELIVRRALHAAGLRFRLHHRDLPGRPDIVLPRFHVVVFVHGCFWHKHNCSRFVWPRARAEFWKAKLLANVVRDRRNRRMLRRLGWKIEVMWECQIDSGKLLALSARIQKQQK